MRKVSFRNWQFEVDAELTRKTFEKTLQGGSDSCICDDCKNYRTQRANIFPQEIIILFDNLGIDYRKECETWKSRKLKNGLHDYHGWFHFAGDIIAGEDCKKRSRKILLRSS